MLRSLVGSEMCIRDRYKMTCETIPTKYVIRDEDGELVRHNNMTFFPTKKDADKALAEIVYKRFEEAAQ